MGLDIYFEKRNIFIKESLEVMESDVQKIYSDLSRNLDNLYMVKDSITENEYMSKQMRDEKCAKLDEEINKVSNDFFVVSDQLNEIQKKYTEEIAYFRKVNFLLPFFDYTENLSKKFISRDKIEELVSICDNIIKTKENLDSIKKESKEYDDAFESLVGYCKELIPTKKGFFFGDTDYDNWYFNDVKDVRDTFKQILDEIDWSKEEVFMSCWW